MPAAAFDLLAHFTPQDVARGAARAFVVDTASNLEFVLDTALLAAFALTGAGRRAFDACRRLGRPLDTPRLVRLLGTGWAGGALFLAAVAVTRQAAALPLSLWRDYFAAHAVGLSRETPGAFLSDQLRDAGLMAFGFALLGAFLPAVRDRWPRRWWLAVGLAGALLLVLDAAADPLRTRLDYAMTPLGPGPLRDGLARLAARTGTPPEEIVVIDSSKDTTAVNAFVMGVGPTRRLVLTDTLVALGPDAVLGAAAHELGHRRAERLPGRLLLASLGLVAFLWFVERVVRAALARGAAATAQALPLVLAATSLVTLALTPARAAFGRAEEREADALELSVRRDYDAYIEEQVALVRANAARPELPWLAALLSDHPSAADRIRTALDARDSSPVRGSR